MANAATIRRQLHSQDPEACAQGLRRLVRYCGTDSVNEQRPTDFDDRRTELGDCEARLFELARSDDEVLRELTADALGAWAGEPALDELLRLAQDPVPRVRATALGSLEFWPDNQRARDALLDGLESGEWTVRMRAARALARFPGPEVDAALLQALVDPDSYVRTNAGESLKRRDPAPWLDKLRALRDYPAPHLLDGAMELLGAVGTTEDERFLKQVGSWLNLSQPSFIRRWARQAARQIRRRHGGK